MAPKPFGQIEDDATRSALDLICRLAAIASLPATATAPRHRSPPPPRYLGKSNVNVVPPPTVDFALSVPP